MTPTRITEKLVELISAVEAVKSSIDRLNGISSDHSSIINGIRHSIETLNERLIAHTERETIHANTLAAVVRLIIGASTIVFTSMLAAVGWLIINPNPWIK